MLRSFLSRLSDHRFAGSLAVRTSSLRSRVAACAVWKPSNRFLAVLSLGLVLLPLTAFKPGLPATFKADEPAYFLAALSLVEDFDLRMEVEDRERIFQSFPYTSALNVIVASGDGWRTLYFGKPYIFSFLAAPFVALWGAEGMVAFNMVLLVAMIWMGALWLRRFNPSWLADLFSVGFFLFGVPYSYVYWLHPEVLNMFAGAACLFFGLSMWVDRSGEPRLPAAWALPLSASCLALGVYNKPMLALLGLPVCIHLLMRRRWRHLALWIASSVLSIALYAAGSWVLTGNATAYLVDLRAGYPVINPYEAMVEPLPPPEPVEQNVQAEDKASSAGWWWILRKPHVKAFELAEDIPLFFLGRHTGLWVYQPFVLLAMGLFVWHGRRRLDGWTILASALGVGALFMVTIPFNWHGGGGFVGNRYFVMACPAFVFLVTKIKPDWLVVPFSAVAGLLIGPLLLAPYGLVVPRPTLQAHVRNPPFSALPMELGLGKIPGYHGMVQEGLWMFGRRDHLRLTMREQLIVAAADTVEIWVQSDAPIERLSLELAGPVEDNPATIRLGEETRRLRLGPEPIEVGFTPKEPTLLRTDRRPHAYFEFMQIWNYRLTVQIERGEMPHWRGEDGPRFFTGGSIRLTEVVKGQAPPLPEGLAEEPSTRRADTVGVAE